MGQGYEHPGPGHPHTHSTYCSQTITPRSGIAKPVIDTCCIKPQSVISDCCLDYTFINVVDIHDPSTFPIAETQLILDGFWRDSRKGVGGSEADLKKSVGVGGSVGTGGDGVGGLVGVGGDSLGGANIGFGGKGVESNEEHGKGLEI